MVEVPFEARVLVGESSCLLESSLLSLGDSLIRRNQDLLYASSAGSAPSPNIMIKSAEISIMAQQSRLRKHVGGAVIKNKARLDESATKPSRLNRRAR